MTEHIGFNKKFQAGLVVQLILDYDFLRNVLEDVHESYFDAGVAIVKLLKLVKSAHKLTKRPLTVDIVRNLLLRLEKVGDYTEPEAAGINEMLDLGLTLTFSEQAYIKDRAYEFIKRQVIAKAVSESIPLLESGHYDSMYQRITNAYKQTFGVGENIGYNYREESVADRYSEPPRTGVWSSGFPKLDKFLDGGFAASECYSVISPTGRGKTALLCNFSVQAMKCGKNVLFIPLEMSEKQICQRQDSILCGFSSSQLAEHRDFQMLLDQAIRQLSGLSFVKEFQRGALTTQQLRTFIERFCNEIWKPDVVVLDWFGCLKLVGGRDTKRHEMLAEAADDFINMSREFKTTNITAHQSNRSAVSQDTFAYDSVSESFASLFGMDLVLGLGATNESKDAGKRTLTILKNRFGPDSVYVKLRGDLPKSPLTFKFSEAPDDDEESDLLGANLDTDE